MANYNLWTQEPFKLKMLRFNFWNPFLYRAYR